MIRLRDLPRAVLSRHPWLTATGLIACLVAFLAVVPVVPFKPWCFAVPGWWESERTVKGRTTPEYRGYLTYGFDMLGVYYWSIGDAVLIRALPWLDGSEGFDQHDVIINVSSKSVGHLARFLIDEGNAATSENYRDPEVIDYIRSFRDPDGSWYEQRDDCAFVQAVVTGRIPPEKSVRR